MKIALLGGSFNPLHIGHCMLAETVIQELKYDKVLFVPVNVPPHKQLNDKVSAEDRFKMIECFCKSSAEKGKDYFIAEDCELKRGGISYTYDTLDYINENYDEARTCFFKSYQIEKRNNNYDGIYYTSFNLAKVLMEMKSKKALDFLLEAKKSAEFINEEFYILESAIALGDYYYDIPEKIKECLEEYFKAQSIAKHMGSNIDIDKITQRINDMKLRMSPEEYSELENKYNK